MQKGESIEIGKKALKDEEFLNTIMELDSDLTLEFLQNNLSKLGYMYDGYMSSKKGKDWNKE